MATQTRKVVGKDHYGRPVYEGQVAIKDAHGNVVYEEAGARSGPAHLKEKHTHPTRSYNTGRKDEHGNEIWATRPEESAA